MLFFSRYTASILTWEEIGFWSFVVVILGLGLFRPADDGRTILLFQILLHSFQEHVARFEKAIIAIEEAFHGVFEFGSHFLDLIVELDFAFFFDLIQVCFCSDQIRFELWV